MEERLEELESILSKELDIHNSLLEIGKEFSEAIKENNIELIRKKTTEQDEHICSIERLEEARNDCCRSISGQSGSIWDSVRFSHILDIAPVSWKKRLATLQTSLKSIIQELASINTSNRILLEEADRIIGKTLTCFYQSEKASVSYSQYGKASVKHSEFRYYNNVI